MLKALAVTGIAASLLASPLAIESASSAPPSGKVTVEVVTVNGSGCPNKTADVAAAADNTAFTVTYSNYLAERGPEAKPTDFRKNCQLSLKIKVPAGFTYAVAQADYRGFAHLVKGATAQQNANYYFMGQSATATVSHAFAGPMSDDWQTTDAAEFASLVWAPCGEVRNLNVNTDLRVYGPAKSTSFMTMDSTDGSFSTKFHFAWKKCTK
ncbi:MAG TPA: DUF4360 domain-containing protein [Pilimelia sp.]|nr:DUF4360 domain-containing protein [Pilimelia sp.]